MTFFKVSCQVTQNCNGEFGLAVITQDGVREYSSLTCDFEKINKLSDSINHSDVSALHIDDIIEDFI